MFNSIYILFNDLFGLIPPSIVSFATIVPFFMSIVSFIIEWLNPRGYLFIAVSPVIRFCADIRFMMFMLVLLLLQYGEILVLN